MTVNLFLISRRLLPSNNFLILVCHGGVGAFCFPFAWKISSRSLLPSSTNGHSKYHNKVPFSLKWGEQSFTSQNHFSQFIQRHLLVHKAGGVRLSLRVHQCICMLLQRGRFWSSNSVLEGQCLIYSSLSYTMSSWGSGGLSPRKFSWTKLLATSKHAPSQSRRDG